MNQYHVYILTKPKMKVLYKMLYTGATNNLERRLVEHYLKRGEHKTFAFRYYCYNLIYYETPHSYIAAIEREKEIKNWNRSIKESLINSFNPSWIFLNSDITEWPPHPKTTPNY